MQTKPLKLKEDGTIVNVSNMNDEELMKAIKTRLKDKDEDMEELNNIHKEAALSIFLSMIVDIILFVYCFHLLLNTTFTFSEGIGVISIDIVVPAILKVILNILIENRHKAGYQKLKEQTSINSLRALYRQTGKILDAYEVRCVFNEFVDTEEFGDIDDIDDETKKTKLVNFFAESLFTSNLQ